jgi:hypothetical protein
MNIQRIQGATRVLGKSQGYLGLPVRDQVMDCPPAGIVPTMTTAWEPTPDELEAIARGAPVYVRIFGTMHPPITVYVGEPPGDEDNVGT